MLTILLIIIYLSFISLGLPDSLLGSAWPAMQVDLGVPVSYAGILSMIVAGGTILSSFFSEKIIRRLGTGLVTAISVLMTAAALLGFYYTHGFIWLLVMGIPLGLGAGSVDAALNNFVALHYEARHMSWLHCFWGIGATIGPIIMSNFLLRDSGWKLGFRTIGFIQAGLVILLFISLPIWNKVGTKEDKEDETRDKPKNLKELLQIPGVKPAYLSFFCYCGVEATTGLWGSSFLVIGKGITVETAAKWISLFYFGITLGRFLSGFVTFILSNKVLIRVGQFIIICGILCIIVTSSNLVLQGGFLLIGLGCAPIYPCMLHDTPKRFGRSLSQQLMGIQMACAYVGTTLMPPFFGFIAEHVSITLFSGFLTILLVLMILSTERVNGVFEIK